MSEILVLSPSPLILKILVSLSIILKEMSSMLVHSRFCWSRESSLYVWDVVYTFQSFLQSFCFFIDLPFSFRMLTAVFFQPWKPSFSLRWLTLTLAFFSDFSDFTDFSDFSETLSDFTDSLSDLTETLSSSLDDSTTFFAFFSFLSFLSFLSFFSLSFSFAFSSRFF